MNAYFGGLGSTIDGTLSFDPPASTMMAGSEAAMALEQEYLAAGVRLRLHRRHAHDLQRGRPGPRRHGEVACTVPLPGCGAVRPVR
ncbi:MAG: META domain-containing protein [Candidatus Nanopelagicales bacterium]